MKVLILGGVAAGTKAAAKIKRQDQSADVTILVKDRDISYAGCGLPYYVGGLIETRDELIVNTPQKYTALTGARVLTGREAVDLDQMIETTAGCSIPEIFQREGESGFRARERAAAEEAGKRTGVILLTGGGIIKTAENYAALHQNGRIYQLVRDLSLLPTEGRPLSQGADLAAMWRERAPLYARFRDVEIDNSGTVEDTAAAIWRDFCAHSGS